LYFPRAGAKTRYQVISNQIMKIHPSTAKTRKWTKIPKNDRHRTKMQAENMPTSWVMSEFQRQLSSSNHNRDCFLNWTCHDKFPALFKIMGNFPLYAWIILENIQVWSCHRSEALLRKMLRGKLSKMDCFGREWRKIIARKKSPRKCSTMKLLKNYVDAFTSQSSHRRPFIKLKYTGCRARQTTYLHLIMITWASLT